MGNENILIHEGKAITDKQRKLIFININISCIATSMLATALTTALPPIMKDFNIDASTGQWITSGFALFIAIVTPLTAYLITSIRTKKLYCTALIFFIAGLTVCALSPNFLVMMIGRIIQGCGSGLIQAMTQVIIITIFPPEKRGTAMGWYGLAVGVSPIIAPTLAGVLVDYVGWRMVFVVSIVIMVISLIFAFIVFEDVLPKMKKSFDVISLGMSALAFGGVTLAIGNMGKYKFVSVQVLLLLIIGIVFSIIFVIRQLRLEVPFLDVRVLKDSKLSISIAATVLIQLMLLGSAIIIPIYVQQLMNESATLSGLVILPGSVLMALISPMAGKIYDKMGMKTLFLVGSITLIISNGWLYFITTNNSVWVVCIVQIFRCFAFGIILMPVVTWGMSDIPKTKASDATALLNSIRSIASAIGSALFVSVMTGVANMVHGKKENPEMYGFNVVFMTMAVLSIIILIFGIFSSGNNKSTKADKKNKEGKEIEMKPSTNSTNEKNEKESISNNNEADLDIVVKED